MRNYRLLGLGIALILVALALAFENASPSIPLSENGAALATALHDTPGRQQVGTVIVRIPVITRVFVTPTATPLLLAPLNPSIDSVVKLVFAQIGKWQLVRCCGQATLAPFYLATAGRRGLLAYGDGLTVMDGAQTWNAAFVAVLLNRENGYRVQVVAVGLGKGNPETIVTLSRGGDIGVRLENMDAGDPSTDFRRALTLAPCEAGVDATIVIPKYGDPTDGPGTICY